MRIVHKIRVCSKNTTYVISTSLNAALGIGFADPLFDLVRMVRTVLKVFGH